MRRIPEPTPAGKKGKKTLAELSGWNPRTSQRAEQGAWVADWWERKQEGGYSHRKKQFPTLPELEKWIEAEHRERISDAKMTRRGDRRGGVVTLTNLTPKEKAALASAITALRAAGGGAESLADAVRVYAQTHLTGAKKKIWRIAGEHLRAVRQRRRPGTYQDRRRVLALLVADHGRKLAATFTTAQVEDWVFGAKSDGMRIARRRAAHALFEFALRRGYIQENPVATVEKIDSHVQDEVSILSADDAAELMERARKHTPSLVPYLAIGLFCGLRPMNELGGLDWKDIDLEGGNITVRRASSKTNRARLVPISPNLREWLETVPPSKRTGRIFYSRRMLEWIVGIEPRRDWRVFNPGKNNLAAQKRGKEPRKKFEPLPWAKNILRHTRTSYRLAQTKNAPMVAEEGGHTPAIMRAHYANRTLPEAEVEKFWSILPTTKSGKKGQRK